MAEKQQYYRIGDLSKAFSLSKNTLRYYELRGVLSPAHEDSSGYRYYDDEQLHRIGSLKKLQNMGLSVDQSKSFLSGATIGEVEVLMSQCLTRETQQAKLHHYLSQKLQEILSRTQDTQSHGRIFRRTLPEHYEMRLDSIRNLVDDRELHRYAPQWFDHVFPVMNIHRLAVKDVAEGLYAPAFALAVDPLGASLLGLDTTNPFVSLYPAQDCLNICSFFGGSAKNTEPAFHYLEHCQAMLRRCQEEDLVPTDAFRFNILFTFLTPDGSSNVVGDLYLPVAPAQN
ncbi:MAG: MerR family transcriptional regulator [Oscillospiraceae bacterium]|nr:MerR family transcriptional regulator [Oscillospiraceae bacterium]